MEYKYIIVYSDGTAFEFARKKSTQSKFVSIHTLFEEGWIPVREVSMGTERTAAEGCLGSALVLLQRPREDMPEIRGSDHE